MKSSRTKVLETILFLKKNINSDWREALDNIGALDDFRPIYDLDGNGCDMPTKNCIVAFIPLAYDNESDLIEIHKDRMENKRRIMVHIAGEKWLDKDILLETVTGGHQIIDRVIEIYINNMRDWRWGSVMANVEYHSRTLGMSFMAEDFKDIASAGTGLEAGEERRVKADQMIETLRKEFAVVDTILEKEGRVPITSRTGKNDFMSFDIFIISRNKKAAAKRAEEEAAQREAEQLKQEKKDSKKSYKKGEMPEDDLLPETPTQPSLP